MRTKWENNADSAVLFFIDDLANRWVDLNNDGKIQQEEDYGYAGFDDNGVFKFLKNEILFVNPKIKTTFFIITDCLLLHNTNGNNVISEPINETERSKDFFRKLHNEKCFEIAYHGTTHGIRSKGVKEFKQEWQSFTSLSEAMETINRGKEIYKDTIGIYPKGGKYCGYISNEFSDYSIEQSGFKWWCRYYNRAAVEGCDRKNYCGEDKNPLTAFNVKFFGKNKIIDIPTTVPGNLLNFAFKPSKGIKGILKKILKPLIIRWKLRKIDYLIKNKLIISIQEHISPCREDGVRQTPNIIDDKDSLREIFKYLKKKSVWYCTCSELAEWVKENK